jgi:hypothetical protein
MPILDHEHQWVPHHAKSRSECDDIALGCTATLDWFNRGPIYDRAGPGSDDQRVVVHNPCGEYFDDLTIASLHGMTCVQGSGDNHDWCIALREDVA